VKGARRLGGKGLKRDGKAKGQEVGGKRREGRETTVHIA